MNWHLTRPLSMFDVDGEEFHVVEEEIHRVEGNRELGSLCYLLHEGESILAWYVDTYQDEPLPEAPMFVPLEWHIFRRAE